MSTAADTKAAPAVATVGGAGGSGGSQAGPGAPDALRDLTALAMAHKPAPPRAPSKPLLPSKTPEAVMARLSPPAAARLHELSARLAGGNPAALSATELKEFESLSGGDATFYEWLQRAAIAPTRNWFERTALNPLNYSPWGFNPGNPYLWTNLYPRYSKLKQTAQQMLELLKAPDLQTSQTGYIVQELVLFLTELDKEVGALQVNQARTNSTTATTVDMTRLQGFEQQFETLSVKFKEFVEATRAFKVTPTVYSQQAVQALMAQPGPNPYAPPAWPQAPPPPQFQPAPPQFQPPPPQFQPPSAPPAPQPRPPGPPVYFSPPPPMAPRPMPPPPPPQWQQQQQQFQQYQQYQQQQQQQQQQQIQYDAQLAQWLAFQDAERQRFQQLQQQQQAYRPPNPSPFALSPRAPPAPLAPANLPPSAPPGFNSYVPGAYAPAPNYSSFGNNQPIFPYMDDSGRSGDPYAATVSQLGSPYY